MKKLIYSILAGSALFLAGCFETTDEVTINEDGTGVFTTTNDMSAVVAVAKQMGGKDAEKMEDAKVDTTISLGAQVDSVENLSSEEKEMMKKGTMHMNVNLKDNKVVISMRFPFTKSADVPKLSQLATKLMGKALKDKMAEGAPMGDMPDASSVDSYYEIKYNDGKIVKKLDKDKYANVDKDEYLKGLRQAGSMGIPINATQVINLPRPAKDVEGKNVKLSDDKKKVTVKTDLDDFFDSPEKLEFKIEY